MAKSVKEKTTEIKPEIQLEEPEVSEEIKIEVLAEKKEQEKDSPQMLHSFNNPELSFKERILGFINKNTSDRVYLNDFLKSLFGTPSPNTKPAWQLQNNSKIIKGVLDDMVTSGEIIIEANAHRLLGKPYFKDTGHGNPQICQHEDLKTIEIFAKK